MKKILILLLIGILVILYLRYSSQTDTVAPVDNTNKTDEQILAPQDGLPPQVEAKRQAIYKAALTRNYEKLAAEAASNFHYSFGGEYEGGFVGYLKLAGQDEGETAFDIIPTLLKLPYAVRDDLYTWPSVFTIEPSKWTPADIAMMRTFLTDEDIESYRQFGGYIYYRLGITYEGNWTFYLAGD